MRSFDSIAIIVIGTVVSLVVMGYAITTSPAYDDTDPPGGRSGMGLHTDAATGCQYLTNPRGGITPRLDAAGRHVCGVR